MALKEYSWYFEFFKMLLFNGFANSGNLHRRVTPDSCGIFLCSLLADPSIKLTLDFYLFLGF